MKTDVMTTDTEVRFKKETKINIHNKVKKTPTKVVPADAAEPALPPAPESIPVYTIPVKITPFNEEKFRPFIDGVKSTLNECRMLTDYMQMSVRSGFDELLCIDAMTGIEKYWYQVETVKKVLKQFHGRVLLCDEVGLGKTIEAGMLIKEYLMRGMIKNVLILAPASLVSQWKEEMLSKFHIEFLTT
ncbi:MAG TPA: hypothetical protein ENH24_03770, partial [Nitrospirae bacterium]|nr:hypothetical protein [Nitrospirota bacterium]